LSDVGKPAVTCFDRHTHPGGGSRGIDVHGSTHTLADERIRDLRPSDLSGKRFGDIAIIPIRSCIVRSRVRSRRRRQGCRSAQGPLGGFVARDSSHESVARASASYEPDLARPLGLGRCRQMPMNTGVSAPRCRSDHAQNRVVRPSSSDAVFETVGALARGAVWVCRAIRVCA